MGKAERWATDCSVRQKETVVTLRLPGAIFKLITMCELLKRAFQQADWCQLQGVKHPRKRFYRARAHSNPLNDAIFDVPAHPDDYEWCDETCIV
jgi:hypothetical protein